MADEQKQHNNNGTLPLLVEYVTQGPWAIEPNVLQQMMGIVERHVAGNRLDAEAIAQIAAAKTEKKVDDRQYHIDEATGTAIIPISGVIAKYARMVNGISSPRGTSVETLRGQLAAAVADRQAKRILLHIESPGGMIGGVPDLAAEIFNARQVKPVIAFADDLAASAAYWLGSQADKLYTTQGGGVGSIGVYTLLVDSSKRAQAEGLRFVLVRSGQFKGVGSPGIEITGENVQAIQKNINDTFELFVAAVMRGRANAGLTEEQLRGRADGRMFIGAEAVENKLADGVATFEETLAMTAGIHIGTVSSIGKYKKGNSPGVQKMSEDTKTVDAAELQEMQGQAVKAERQRIVAINQALGGEPLATVREKAIADGLTVEAAKAMAFEAAQTIHAGQVVALEGQLAEANKRLEVIASAGGDLEAGEPSDADQETDSALAGDNGKAQTYVAEVDRLEATGMTRGQAFRQAARKLPKCHEAWKGSMTPDRSAAGVAG